MDGLISMVDPRKYQLVRILGDDSVSDRNIRHFGHTAGITTFSYCDFYRCILSAGFDRNVFIW